MVDALQKGTRSSPPAILGKVAKITDAYVVLEVAQGTSIQISANAQGTPGLPKGTIKLARLPRRATNRRSPA